jgi:hypothetical protein
MLHLWGEKRERQMASNKKGVHVTPRSDGRWNVTRDNAQRASSVHDTQATATNAARDTARREHTELFVHGRDGQIRSRDSYGNDPHPPRG